MKKPNNRWCSIQYRGDAADIRQLYDQYNVDGFLSTREADEQQSNGSLRNVFLKDGVLLNETVSPRIHRIVHGVQQKLDVPGSFDVFCLPDNDVNAFAFLNTDRQYPKPIIGITSAALENLDDKEIASLLGHEIGHFIFGHNRLLGLLNLNEKSEAITVLPYMGECLFLRWRKKSEVSADRLGLIASGSFESSARALVKAGFGLSQKNINPDVDSLLKQIESIKDKPEIIEAAYRSHPLLPLRLKALHLFAQGLNAKGPSCRESVDEEVDRLFAWTKRYPRKRLTEALMQVVATAGMILLGVENDVDEEEIRAIIYALHRDFTDEPESELILDPAERKARLKKALTIVAREGDTDDKLYVLSRLADIALADGRLLNEEAGVILEVAQAMGIPPKQAYAVMVGAAQVVGFQVDFHMKNLTRKVRNQLVQSVRVSAGINP